MRVKVKKQKCQCQAERGVRRSFTREEAAKGEYKVSKNKWLRRPHQTGREKGKTRGYKAKMRPRQVVIRKAIV